MWLSAISIWLFLMPVLYLVGFPSKLDETRWWTHYHFFHKGCHNQPKMIVPCTKVMLHDKETL